MDVNPTMLCMGCMNPLPEAGAVCSRCGYDNAHAENELHQLPCGSILAGAYLVGKALGQGGFGITYIGWDLNLNLKIAIKEFFPEGCVRRDSTMQATVTPLSGSKGEFFANGKTKFVEEGRALARFSGDPAIVNVRTLFYENGTAYIVMEFVDGETMQQYAARMGGKLPAQEILARFRPLLRSLAEVHQSGLLHRDISPDNIMIRENGSVKLLDFGAARQVSAMGEHSNTINVKHGYAPEEQYRTHGQQGPWTDVYALCATVYKLATGVTPAQAMDRAMSDLPLVPPNDLGADFTPQQQNALLHGLAIRAKDRTPDMAALERELYGTGAEAYAPLVWQPVTVQQPRQPAQNQPPQPAPAAVAPMQHSTPKAPAPQMPTPQLKSIVTWGKKLAKKKWLWIAAAVAAFLLLCYGHIQMNLNAALKCYSECEFTAANRHMKMTVIGELLYPEDKPLMEAGMLIESGQYDEAAVLLKSLDGTIVSKYAEAAKEIIYQQGIAAYRDGNLAVAEHLFNLILKYSRSQAYLTLIAFKEEGISNERELWNDLVPLIGFEDAGQIIFYDDTRAFNFLKGKFVSKEYYIGMNYRGKIRYLSWNLPYKHGSSWGFEDGQLRIGGVPTLNFEALSKDEIRIVHVTTGETYVLQRES